MTATERSNTPIKGERKQAWQQRERGPHKVGPLGEEGRATQLPGDEACYKAMLRPSLAHDMACAQCPQLPHGVSRACLPPARGHEKGGAQRRGINHLPFPLSLPRRLTPSTVPALDGRTGNSFPCV